MARSPLPPKLRAVNLALDDELYNNTADLYVSTLSSVFLSVFSPSFSFDRYDVTYSYFQKQQNNYRPSSASASLNNTNIPPSTNVISRLSPITRSPITVEDDRRNERVVQGMRLLLVARERTLTLAEQRVSRVSDLFSSMAQIETFL